MTATLPKLVLLEPTTLDSRRVMLTLKTTGFPPRSNIPACMVNFAPPASGAPVNFELGAPLSATSNSPAKAPRSNGKAQDDAPAEESPESPYPNVELSLLDADNNEVAQAMIIEHQEAEVSFTLHIRQPQVGQPYTARASMFYDQELLQSLSTPFLLEVPHRGRMANDEW